MNFSNYYIEQVIIKNELETYTDAMRIIGGSEGQMSKVKKGTRTLSKEQCIGVANNLGIDSAIVFAGVEADKAKSEDEKRAWKRLISGFKDLPKLEGLELILCKVMSGVSNVQKKKNYVASSDFQGWKKACKNGTTQTQEDSRHLGITGYLRMACFGMETATTTQTET